MENKDLNKWTWTWTPSPVMNWMIATILRLPVLHHLLSKMMLVITFTGKKSGKTYVTPVGYYREGNRVTILTKRFRKWWLNFETAAPVEVLITGHSYAAQAASLTDTEIISPIIAHVVEKHRGDAQNYGIKLGNNGKADMESVREVAAKLVVVQLILTPEKIID